MCITAKSIVGSGYPTQSVICCAKLPVHATLATASTPYYICYMAAVCEAVDVCWRNCWQDIIVIIIISFFGLSAPGCQLHNAHQHSALSFASSAIRQSVRVLKVSRLCAIYIYVDCMHHSIWIRLLCHLPRQSVPFMTRLYHGCSLKGESCSSHCTENV